MLLKSSVSKCINKLLCFKNLRYCSSLKLQTDVAASDMTKPHVLQQKALKENCILIDDNDNAIGSTTKEDCHRVNAKTGSVKLHRAFSVFLFNTKDEMLIQRRSEHKITFPDMYTNACCSHPLYDREQERNESNAHGVRSAAQRRLNYELGIPMEEIMPENFHYLTRIHYAHPGDGVWGEHEIDYILFLQKDVTIKPNHNEISEVHYVKRENLEAFVSDLKAPLTPWFQLILRHRLTQWWDNLHQLKHFEDQQNICRFL